jgi:NAD-dependent DNA ligase
LKLRGSHAGSIEIRGEVYLPRKVFERINSEKADAGEPLFANPRNAAAGTMRNLDPALVAKRGLSAWMYQLVGGPKGPPLRSSSCAIAASAHRMNRVRQDTSRSLPRSVVRNRRKSRRLRRPSTVTRGPRESPGAPRLA